MGPSTRIQSIRPVRLPPKRTSANPDPEFAVPRKKFRFPSAEDAPKLLARNFQLAADSLPWPSKQTRWDSYKRPHPFGPDFSVKIEVYLPTKLRRWWLKNIKTGACHILHVERDSILDKDMTYDD